MYTRCPHCRTWFGISASQLREGRGEARCGSCFESFGALEYLTDEAPKREAGNDVHDDVSPNTPISQEAQAQDLPQTQTTRLEDHLQHALNEAEGQDHTGTASPSKADRTWLDGNADLDEPPTKTQAEIPEVLLEDLATGTATRRARRFGGVFAFASLILLITLIGQYAHFMSHDVLQRYPQSRPWLVQLCSYTGCKLPALRDPKLIRVVGRDVRIHPDYEGALLVTAVLMNSATFAQPYPLIQFTLFNVNGQVIAARNFEPNEYLSLDVDEELGMKPGAPVQIVLETLAPEQPAVSFEFRFF